MTREWGGGGGGGGASERFTRRDQRVMSYEWLIDECLISDKGSI